MMVPVLRHWPFALATLGVLAAAVVLTRDDDFVRWPDGTVHGPWRAVYDGHGTNGSRGGVIKLRPKPATQATETHAGLIVSLATHRDVDLRLRTRTLTQLRTGRPNPWESAWVVWSYTDDEHFYYLALKPNGWELGKRDPAYPGGQRFLATGTPTYTLKRWYNVHITQRGPTLTVRTNGRTLTTFTDTERPYRGGSIGLYTEDAEVEFRDIRTTQPPAKPGTLHPGDRPPDPKRA